MQTANPIDTTQTLLVAVTMGLPRQSVQRKDVAVQAEQKANAARGTSGHSVYYWKWEEGEGKAKIRHDGMEKLREFQSAYKRAILHYARYPYVAGAWMLPAALAPACLKVKADYEKQEPEIRETFAYGEGITDYPALVKSAPKRMGQWHSESDFPSLKECLDRFVCDVTIVPLAAAEQVQRIAILSPDIAKTIEEGASKAYAKGKEEALVKLWSDIMDPIQHAVTTLEKDGAKIFDTLVGNIIDIVDLIPAYNGVFNDPHLNNLAAQAKAAFGEIKPDDLRASNEAKAKMLESAKSIVNSFKPYQRKLAV